MNILILSWKCIKNPKSGGAEKVTYEVAKRWIKNGNNVHIICSNYKYGKKNDYIDKIKITRMGNLYSIFFLTPFYYLFILKEKYDVVIDQINTVPFFAHFYSKTPTLAFIHQLAADVVYHRFPRSVASIWNIIEPKLLKLYHNKHFVTVSNSTKNDLLNIGIKQEKIHIISLGIDHNLHNPGTRAKHPLLLYAGRIERNKRIHSIVESMKKIIQVVPKTHFSIIGRGSPRYIKELNILIQNLGLEERVTFHGFLEESKKIEFMQKAWLLTLPSQREGFGLVVIEANACGTPAIVTDVPGLRDSVKHNVTGIIVPLIDNDAMTEEMIKLLKNEQTINFLSKNAIEWAENFTWENTAIEFLNYINLVMGNARSI